MENNLGENQMILTCSAIYRTGKSLGTLPGETSRQLIFIGLFFFF